MMETNFVDSPQNEVEDMSLREGDADIVLAAQQYMAVQAKIKDLLARAEDRHISGSPGTIYLKRLGHRPLSTTDFDNIVNALGSDEDKKALIDFAVAQEALQERLKATKAIGLVLEQAEITRDLYYNRAKRADLWKPEEVLKVMEVLDRLRV
jgi:hypothetical protein